LRRAVASEDVTALTRVPGIGRKGAQRIVLELAGRLGAPGMGSPSEPGGVVVSRRGSPAPWREQVRAGLVNLGWQARDADQAIAAVEADLADGEQAGEAAPPDAAIMLRAALRKLSRA
jgi:Holliday junction DNA helicase RuvA